MASITPRRRKGGIMSYTAQIRISVDGKTHTESKTLTDRKQLERWVEEREAALRQPGAIEREQHRGTTVGNVLDYYKQDFQRGREFSRTKLSHIDFLIGHSVGQLDALALTPPQLIDHAYERSATAAPSTILNDFVWLRNAYRAIRIGRNMPLDLQVIDDAMFILRKERVIGPSKQRDRRPTLDELNKLLAYFSDRDKRADVPMVDLTLFALFSTRRQNEITRLQCSDLDERRNGVLVRDMKHPRSVSDTFCVLTDPAWAIIKRQPKGDIIFPYNSKTVSAAFTRACSFLGISNLHYHDLRHDGISWLFELQLDIPRVAAVSGHKSWTSLQRYTHLQEHGFFDKYAGWEWLPEANLVSA